MSKEKIGKDIRDILSEYIASNSELNVATNSIMSLFKDHLLGSLPITFVSGSEYISNSDAFEFAKHFKLGFEFHDSTDSGDVYKDINTNRPPMTCEQIFKEWKVNKFAGKFYDKYGTMMSKLSKEEVTKLG